MEGRRDGSFADALRRLRTRAGLSQRALAERAGLSVDAIAALERGRRARPRPATLALLADALELAAPERAALAAARSGPSRPAAESSTSFVGRAGELAELDRVLAGARLLTLTGPGGIGKTRLARRLAAAAAAHHRDGTWFAALDACHDTSLVTGTVAVALGVREEPGRPLLASVLAWLRDRDVLLVLDGCEHVAGEVGALAEAALRAAPRLRVLATSRSVLHTAGEVTWRVPPLAEPDAARLFVERASSIGPGDAAAVAELCRRVDRIPLAIELAAAQAALRGLDQALSRLGRPLALAATIDWSHRLLPPAGRRLLRRLSVFAGGFDLEAADAVHEGPALDPLTTLIDHSLVIAEPAGGQMRYRLLDTIRRYAAARLEQHGETAWARRRHAEHYLTLARRADAEIQGGQRAGGIARLLVEQGNLRRALDWGRAGEGDLGLRLATQLGRYWTQAGQPGEGRVWLEAMLVRGGGDRELLATALGRAGDLAYLQGDYQAAWSWLERSLALKRVQGDEPGVARRLGRLSAVAMAMGQGTAAERVAGEALEVHRRLGDPRGIAWAYVFLGWAAQVAGDHPLAAASFDQALTIHRTLRDPAGIAYDLLGLAGVAVELGDIARMRDLVAEAAPLIRGPLRGMPAEPAWVWAGLVLAEAEGRDPAALRLAGAVAAMEHGGVRWNETLRRRYEPHVERARSRLGAEPAARLMDEGSAMTCEELLDEALAGGA